MISPEMSSQLAQGRTETLYGVVLCYTIKLKQKLCNSVNCTLFHEDICTGIENIQLKSVGFKIFLPVYG